MIKEYLVSHGFQWSPYSIPPLISSVIFVSLGLFVLSKNRKSKVNILFALYCVPTSWWQFSWFILFNVKNNDALASVMVKVGYTGITFIAVTMVHFIAVLWDLKKHLKFVYFSYAIGFVLLGFLWTTDYYIQGFYRYFFGYYPKANFLHIGHLIHQLVLGGGYGYLLLWIARKKFKNNRLRYTQVKYIFLAFIIYLPAALDYLLNWGWEFYPFGFIFIMGTASILAFTIIRYKLMEIDTVFHQTFMWAMTVLFLILPVCLFLSLSLGWFRVLASVWRVSILAIVLLVFLGYYHRLKPGIDHLFRRRKYDYQKALVDIPSRIGTELNLSVLMDRLFRQLEEVLYVQNSLLMVKLPEQHDYREAGSSGYGKLEKLGISKIGQVVLISDSSLIRWLSKHPHALELEHLMVDPQYDAIREEAAAFFDANALSVIIPLLFEGTLSGLLGLGKKENLQPYRIKDLELLERLGTQISITIDNALHHQDIVEKQRLQEELRLGRELQTSLLPTQIPRIPGMNLYGLMHPAKEIGGDYYDFIIHGGEKVMEKEGFSVAIGDVSGKGLDAGIVMAMTKTIIFSLALQPGLSPHEILNKANEILYFHVHLKKFVTLLYLSIIPQENKIVYSAAGHERILLCRRGDTPAGLPSLSARSIEVIKSGGVVLGMIDDIKSHLKDTTLDLNKGDKILLYTDGATEARNPREDMFGLERLVESFQKHAHLPVKDTVHNVYQDIRNFISTRDQYDDITLVGIEKD